MEQNKITFKEAEISKIKLEPGEVLVVKIFADDTSPQDLGALKAQLKQYFPNNKIMLFAMPVDGRLEMDVLDTRPNGYAPTVNTTSSCAEPMSYCNDCGCGKKERIEGIKK